MVPLVPELSDHGLDVAEGPVSGIGPALGLLDGANLPGDLLSGVLGELLHVLADVGDLRVQILIALVCVLETLLQLQVLQFQLVDHALVLSLFLSQAHVALSELIQLCLEFGELLLELVHGGFVRPTVVVKLGLQLVGPFCALGVLLFELASPVEQFVAFFDQVVGVHAQVLHLAFELSVDLQHVHLVKLLGPQFDVLDVQLIEVRL